MSYYLHSHPIFHRFHHLFKWPWLLALMIWVFFLCVLGFTKLQLEFMINDKLLHFTAFFIFYFLLFECTHLEFKWKLWGAFFIGISASIMSEFIQGLLSYRTFDPNDIYANLSGTTVSFFISVIRFYAPALWLKFRGFRKVDLQTNVSLLPRFQNDLVA
ncbi:hypothetical protein HMI54_001876 [Coelomomyces lativittatus]|nr:hypothetical protein HMI56_000167 [Coelomomyces lativittatus]KAJ1510081.1 hypothetical protein HMI54_001876 [Coelomomyces lativittatus]KAJ1513857.1 hypothetical protein HMI55_005167 [Coelomomyces lativittatus]